MSIFTKEDRKDLVFAMRKSLLEQTRSVELTESTKASAENFILNEATYEQLLNLAFNPERDTNYLPSQVLEKVALESYAQFLKESNEAQEEAVEETQEEAVEETQEESAFEAVEESVVTEGPKFDAAKKWVSDKAKATWAHMKAGPAKDAYKKWQEAKAAKADPEVIKKARNAFLKAGGKTTAIYGGIAAGAAGTAYGVNKYLKKRREKKG